MLQGCSLVEYIKKQISYRLQQKEQPSQKNLKYILSEESTIVFGKLSDPSELYNNQNLVVVAFSDRFTKDEIVSNSYHRQNHSHFGLYLPVGNYQIGVFADLDNNGKYQSHELVGSSTLKLSTEKYKDHKTRQINISLTSATKAGQTIDLPVPPEKNSVASAFFPPGTIRSLNDSVFDANMSKLGMYEPGVFMERAPGMLYASEEDFFQKIPVIFVHGIGGSARNFQAMSDTLDKKYYKPLYFHYPSGADLNQMAELFYSIFLSGELYKSPHSPMVVVAHSMGGIIVKEALNRYQGNDRENNLKLFISMATPFGGHPSLPDQKSKVTKYLLPSWKNLNTDSQFITKLFRKPLHSSVEHKLIFFYRNNSKINLKTSSDGVIPAYSQLRDPVQQQATEIRGFNKSHAQGVTDASVIQYVTDSIQRVKNNLALSHFKYIQQGGYNIRLDETFSQKEMYAIRHYGFYLKAIFDNKINSVIPETDHLHEIVYGDLEPDSYFQAAWKKFYIEYPELASTAGPK